jgi:hypothetical protein
MASPINACLKDYWKLEGCSGSTVGNSGYYLNRFLEGLNLEMLDFISSEQQSNFAGTYSDCQDRAIEIFKHDVRQELAKRYRLKSIKQSVDNERNIDTSTTTTASAQWRGFMLEQNTSTSKLTNSNLSQFYVQTIALYGSNYSGAVTYNIYNIDTGAVLSTGTITSVANQWNSVDIYEYFDAKRIFIAYDATNLNSVEQDIADLENAVQNPEFDGVDYCFDDYGYNVRMNGAVAENATPTTITKGNDAFGLSAVWNLTCTFDNLVCQNIDNFRNALAYCIGIEICNERQFTNRLNEYTVFDRDQSMELKKLYMVKYKGGFIDDIEYQGLLTQSIEGVNMDKHDACLECDADVNFTDALL